GHRRPARHRHPHLRLHPLVTTAPSPARPMKTLALPLLLVLLGLAAAPADAQTRWLQTVEVIAPVDEYSATGVLLDSLVQPARRRGDGLLGPRGPPARRGARLHQRQPRLPRVPPGGHAARVHLPDRELLLHLPARRRRGPRPPHPLHRGGAARRRGDAHERGH